MRIFIEDLVLEGVHGVTAKEKKHRQPFRVDVSIEVEDPGVSQKDSIDHTLDYREIKQVVTKVVVEESHDLLETIVARIVDELFGNDRALSVEVTVRKIAIWSSGVPGVTICRKK